MIVGFVLIGIVAGLVGLFATVLLGGSLLSALFAYMAVGAATTLLVPTVMYALHCLLRSADDDVSVRSTDAGTGDESAVTDGSTRTTIAPAVGAMTILAVDDDPFIRELIPKIASMAGFPNVVTARSAEDALQLLARPTTSFDCILLDIHMPGIDGIELCARIRSIPGYLGTPIIMLTAMSDTEYLDRAFKAGATDYATKPFDVIEFGERLKAAETVISASRRVVAEGTAHQTGKAIPVDAMAAPASELLDPVQIEGVTNFIDLAALSNYVTRLSGRKLVRSVVMVVQALQIEHLHGTMSPTLFKRLLEGIAETIDEVLVHQGYVGAYAGSGQFVLLSDWDAICHPADVERKLQCFLEQKSLIPDLGLSGQVELVMGAPVRLRTARENRARDAIGTALDLADMRAATEPEGRLRSVANIGR